MTDSALREVYSAADVHEAHFIRSGLEEVGIEARVVGDHLQSAVGELPAIAIAPRIWVHAEKFDAARKFITEFEARRNSKSPATGQWTCGECGETNESSFDICWSCQTARDGEPPS